MSSRKARAARAVLALIVGGVVMVSLPAAAGAATCPDVEPTSQPFLEQGDDLHYFIAPGGDFERSANAWRVNGYAYAAKALNPYDYAGHRGLVLDGASATSPGFCVDNTRPLMRLGARILDDNGLSDAQLTVEGVLPDGSAVVLGQIGAADFWAFGWSPQLPLAPPLGLAEGDSTSLQLRVTARGRWGIDGVSIDPYRH